MSYTTTNNFRTLNLGPLTTTFTAPSSCLATTSASVGYYGNYYWVGFWPDRSPNSTTVSDSCIPPAETPLPLRTWYYSPGICPSGYMPGASLGTGPSRYGCTTTLPSSVTAWLCCPTGYTPYVFYSCGWDGTDRCLSTVSRTVALTNVLPWSTTRSDSSITVIRTGEVVATSVVYWSSVTVTALGLPIMWESTDTEVASWFAQASKGSPLTYSTRSDISAYYTPKSTYTYTSSSTSSGGSTSLSPLQLAGIGLGLAGLFLGILGYCLKARANIRAGNAQVQSQSSPEVTGAPPPRYEAIDHSSRAV